MTPKVDSIFYADPYYLQLNRLRVVRYGERSGIDVRLSDLILDKDSIERPDVLERNTKVLAANSCKLEKRKQNEYILSCDYDPSRYPLAFDIVRMINASELDVSTYSDLDLYAELKIGDPLRMNILIKYKD